MDSSEALLINKQLQAVKDVIASFLASLKSFGLYPENHTICHKCLANFIERLEAFFNTYGSLKLDVEKESLIYQGEIVFQELAGEEKLAFFLYRDGIRWIEFNKGLKGKEIKNFLKILNLYRSIQENPEGDLVTELWEMHFSHIRYKASDIYWDSEPLLELNLSSTREASSFGKNIPEKAIAKPLTAALQSQEKKLFELNADETAKIQEMIIKEKNQDILADLLGLASLLVEDQANKNDLIALLRIIKNEIKVVLTRKNFNLANKTLKSLHEMLLVYKTKKAWVISILNWFIKSISQPQYLSALLEILPIFDKADLKNFQQVRQFLMLLHPNAILTLAPVLSQIRSKRFRRQLLEIIEIMAKKDLQPLEQLLSSNDESMVQSLVYIAGRIPNKKVDQILLKMLHNPSDKIRKQAIKQLIARESVSLEIIFPFIEDSSESIRQLILDYLEQKKPKKGQALLTDYLQQKRFLIKNYKHIIACYKTLGKCGSSESIPFLQQILFNGRWFPDFRRSLHRQGSIIALHQLRTKEAIKLLQKASKSFCPTVRIAYKRGSNSIH